MTPCPAPPPMKPSLPSGKPEGQVTHRLPATETDGLNVLWRIRLAELMEKQ